MSETETHKRSSNEEPVATTLGIVQGGTVSAPPPSSKDFEAAGEPEPAPAEDDDEVELLPKGNPFRLKRGIVATVVGLVPALLLMARNGQAFWAVPLGALFIALAAFGVMDLLGTFDDADEHVAARTTLARVGSPLGATFVMLVAYGVSLWAAQGGLGPWWVGSVTVTGTFLGLVAALFALGRALGPFAKDELGEDRPLFRRHGFWVVAVGAFLYLPSLGLYTLWDPWETHYGEVAREILARDDWISLWWAQDGWFWSKPILNFWIQALSMATLKTGYLPDQFLIGLNGTANARPEWALRTPNVLMTIAAMYVLYKGVAKVFGRRAGLLGAIVLATMPDWFFLAHQTMTDMPFVSAMTAAMGLLLFGLNTDEDERVRVYEVKAFGATLRFSLWHLVFGAVLLCAIPQILYLISRNVELVVSGDGPKGFRFHWDEFTSGSKGNCGLPGNEVCASHFPATMTKSAALNAGGVKAALVHFFAGVEPALQGIVWAILLGTLLWINWGERRTRRLVYIGAWLCAAIATMAKGPAGFALPILCACAYVATKKRWRELLELELLSGLLVVLAVALPWYVAMYVRHGSPFTDRLIFHDMFNRMLSHVHDTNEGDDTGMRYYVWQLGYALFPWSALAPLGLLWSFRRSDSAASRSGRAVGDASILLVMWALFAYALFTFMGTKFHHYIFPAVPPIAMLVGVVLDDMLGAVPFWKARKLPAYLAGATVALVLAVYGVSRFFPGSLTGIRGREPSVIMGAAVLAMGVALLGVVLRVLGSRASAETAGPADGSGDDAARRAHEALMFGGASVAGALLLLLVGRDLAIKPENADMPGAIRLLHLFTYNYRRPWPDSLDFGAILWGFTLVGAVLVVAMAGRRIRAHAIAAFAAFACIWAVWGVDVYMVKTASHWGQHEIVEAYYRDRKSPDDLLVAYQMNWKGENIYTGNRVPAFVSSGATFTNWLKQQRDKGAKTMYFVTEHTRINGLRAEVGGKAYKELTDKNLNNKFVLVRAEL